MSPDSAETPTPATGAPQRWYEEVQSCPASTHERPKARVLCLLLEPVSQLLRSRAVPSAPRDRYPTVHQALAPPSVSWAEVSAVRSTNRVSMLSWFTPESIQLEV